MLQSSAGERVKGGDRTGAGGRTVKCHKKINTGAGLWRPCSAEACELVTADTKLEKSQASHKSMEAASEKVTNLLPHPGSPETSPRWLRSIP